MFKSVPEQKHRELSSTNTRLCINGAAVWMNNSWLVAVFSRSVRPVAFFAHCFGGLAFAELVFLVLFFAPKAAHLAWFVGIAKDQWRVGLDSLYMLTGVTETQYWVERLGMWFSVDFQIMVRCCMHTHNNNNIAVYCSMLWLLSTSFSLNW